MARPERKISKNEVKIISKYYRGGMDLKSAMEKLGVSDHNTFNRIFRHAMMTLSS